MLLTDCTPIRLQSSSTMRMSFSGSFALRHTHTKESPESAGMMSSRV